MADQGMKNLERLYATKVHQRIREIQRYIWTDHVPVDDVALAETPDHLSPGQAARLDFRKVAEGHRWGRPWGTGWFRLRIRVPRAFAGETVALLFAPGGECLVFRDGQPVQALDRNRSDVVLFEKARGGERLTLYVEAGANETFGGFAPRTMGQPRLAVFDPELWEAGHDLAALAGLMDALPEDDTRRARLLFGLNKAVDRFDYLDRSREGLRRSARRVRRALQPLLAQGANASAQTIACMGHAHIDVAWLWPLAETVRKCGRTFSTAVAYMDRYPEYVFCQSQPQLYEFTRDRYPALYERIRAKVRRGQWVPTGCMWVEADCNVPSGESLVRQVLFGTRFFRQEFGHEACCLWLPDVFGYSAALPQILRRSGIPYFLTQKISWSQFTTFPHHTFWWEGIDGSRVLAHFPPANDYNSQLLAGQMRAAAARYREKDRSPIQAVPYGFGDGGGGPTRDHLERLRRYGDLEGMPSLRPMTPRQFFQTLEKDSEALRTWVGELYLQLHRATLTTQAANKQLNRRCELALRDAEMLAALGLADGQPYPHEKLHQAWKTVLLNQFHDIIPGSSIALVYQDSARDYARVLDSVGEVRDAAFDRYAEAVDTRGEGTPVLAFNSLSWERRDLVAVRVKGLRRDASTVAVGPDGTESPVQLCGDGLARFVATTPSVGHAVFHIRRGRGEAPEVEATERGMENDVVRLRFDQRGRIRSLVDKRSRREVVARGAAANQFLLFEDKPAAWDAWDVDIFYNEKLLEADGRLLGIEVKETGPVGSVVRVRRAISRSVVSQDVILVAGSPRVDFLTTIHWGEEENVLLKVAFPVAVRAAEARYEIQFGSVARPTHWNTPQDFARFEVCGHKWADLSEGDYGVALLNDAKYGHDIRGNVIRLSLLRAPKSPDPTADVGKTHRFTYALLPHAGDHTNGVVRAGYQLNVPVLAQAVEPSGGAAPQASWMSVSGENVVIDTVKRAEDGEGLIVRLYEAHGCRGRRTFRTALPLREVVETDLMEREERRLSARGGRVRLTV
ncbi:MAG: alpha-mannosidase [Candidatus Brocadiia bacterium]